VLSQKNLTSRKGVIKKLFRNKKSYIEAQKKACFRGNTEKLLSGYYRHKQMGDGHLNKCKECTKRDSIKRSEEKSKDPRWREHERNGGREKYHRLEYKGKNYPRPEKKKETASRHKAKYPEKEKARRSLGCIQKKVKQKHIEYANMALSFNQ
jgi:hypothetical protein